MSEIEIVESNLAGYINLAIKREAEGDDDAAAKALARAEELEERLADLRALRRQRRR